MFGWLHKNYTNLNDFHIKTIKIVCIYFGITLGHFIASSMYAKVCAPLSFTGYLMMPFIIVTPHCNALRWAIQCTGEQIGKTWIWLGGYLVLHITNMITSYSQAKINPLEKIEQADTLEREHDENRRTRRRMS